MKAEFCHQCRFSSYNISAYIVLSFSKFWRDANLWLGFVIQLHICDSQQRRSNFIDFLILLKSRFDGIVFDLMVCAWMCHLCSLIGVNLLFIHWKLNSKFYHIQPFISTDSWHFSSEECMFFLFTFFSSAFVLFKYSDNILEWDQIPPFRL